MTPSSRRSEEARRSGRRPGATGTRAAILDAARRQFAAKGYDRTSLRAIAAEAGVDQALVAHFFGSKMQLFVAVVEPPADPRQLVSTILGGPRAEIGERAARVVVTMLDTDEVRRRVVGLVRAAATEPEAARMVRELVTREIWFPLAEGLGVDDATLRVSLVATQILGLVMVRHVLEVEPLASMSPDDLVALMAPVLQRYLLGPLAS